MYIYIYITGVTIAMDCGGYVAMAVYRYSGIVIHRCVDMSVDAGGYVCRYISISVYRYIELSVYRYIGISVYRYIGIYIDVLICRLMQEDMAVGISVGMSIYRFVYSGLSM